MKTKVNGITINYETYGDSGKWITLVHGAQDNLNVWWNQVALFSKKYRVLAIDWRGHGDTETPALDYKFEILVQDLYELWQHLGIKQTYLNGHSMGGGIVIRAALAYPEIVKALIITNSGVAARAPSKEENERLMAERRQRWDYLERVGFWPYDDDDSKLSPAERMYKAMKLRNDPKKYVRMIRTLDRAGTPPDTSVMKCPTLIISGEYDGLGGPDAGKTTQDLIPGSKRVVLPTGHNPHVETPEEYNKIILEFLGGLSD
ncbi:MAG: alpha/beta hydrolase [Chloroflexi bacterium]|jgi:3-oxoadipate enol-lactonase|nr:alpha/beta hydrolase [Chloroflexota bacterium]MBT7081295.1 alpha/beta hydrolase [Chloroflexota bacterium]